MNVGANLLEVKGLYKSFPVAKKGFFGSRRMTILRDVNLSLREGEILGLVGESGSGKSTIGRAILSLSPADAGSITFDGVELKGASSSTLKRLRKDMQIVFQDPYASLDPRKSVRATLNEALDTHKLHLGKRREARLRELLELVGLNPEFLDRHPHQFSGGQRQRIGIARALAVEPRFIVADEAVSALDVSIQAQILNLIADLRAKTGISMLFISHDLSVVRFISDRVVVLYLGKIMETGPADDVHFSPAHPYTAALVSAEPSLHHEAKRVVLKGEVPSPLSPPSGCVFRTRCPFSLPACATEVPTLREFSNGRWKACIRDDILELQR
ncbi:oligopeptide/dipeptide ABC transporter ATP-binding protein (plasmid) [Agrobacterium tumefaciens]|uniref:ABC transporter ATP-binding protein n=1 Tax=Agrobacterium tumefaciens TaxID=358 RepID=UPI000E0BC0FA|nr:oligopeptide/dipeptide ABC transporter ATP-binding protein [Agrobacterium tumefaciens]WQE43522.1 oligopeptide/dipeptide ABC transporter ATP-binding protein [Agrobacterium tumefaciens]